MGRTPGAKHTPAGVPIDLRVARHVTATLAIIDALNELYPDKAVKVEGMPSYQDIIKFGLGHYMKLVDTSSVKSDWVPFFPWWNRNPSSASLK